MTGLELVLKIQNKWTRLIKPVVPSDSEYKDGINDSLVHKFWHKWKYGFLGFGGAPLYIEEGQDCDDLVRHFIVMFRRKYCVKGLAQPIFYTAYDEHAYCSYINQDGHVVSVDLRDGKIHAIESYIAEMV